MLVFRGKLNWYNYAVDEGITVIFPGPDIKVGSPVITAWQWTKDASGTEKSPVYSNAPVDEVILSENGQHRVLFHQSEYYRFTGTFSADFKSLSLVMTNPKGDTPPANSLTLVYNKQSARTDTPSLYWGKFNWYNYAVNESYLAVFPNGTGTGNDALAFWEWTVDSNGHKKKNVNFIDKIRVAGQSADTKSFVYGESDVTYYHFDNQLKVSGGDLHMTMKNPRGDATGPWNLTAKKLK